MTDTTLQITSALAEYATGKQMSDLPDDAVELTRRSLVDTLGVIIAARGDDAVRILRAALGGEVVNGPSLVYADGSRTAPMLAALINGVAGHALDLDDVTEIIYGHPSVALWPAILAVAEARHCTEREVVEAYVAGFAVLTAVAAGMDVRAHYAKGWHSTATIGVLGATAAVARLMRLDTPTTSRAIGLAASMAGGSRQNFGTMTKPLHPGLAGRDAVFAANLAARGFTADEAVLESSLGYYSMFAEGADLEAVTASLDGPWSLLEQGLNVKKYPCCFNTHRTADAILDLISRDDVVADEVKSARVTLEPGGFDPLIHHRPRTGLEGKFSAEYVIAAALLDRRITLSTFTDAAVQRPPAQEIVARVEFAESAHPPVGDAQWSYAYSAIELSTGRGELTFRTDVPRGDHRVPLDRPALETKFRDCLDFSGIGWDAEATLARLWRFGEPVEFTGFTGARC